MLRAIPFMFMHKISSQMICVNGNHTWRDILTGEKKSNLYHCWFHLIVGVVECYQTADYFIPPKSWFFKVKIVVLQMRTY